MRSNSCYCLPLLMCLAAATQALDITAALTGKSVPGEIYVWDATPVAAER